MLIPNAPSSQPCPAANNCSYSQTQSNQDHQQYCPIPPSTSTIPGPPNLSPDEEDYASGNNCNFKIISQYPIPITEL
ncbi:unnamed protein product [Anisakis simplex]|uniref:Uncharacterized protein n=1 Tax=Anisakis simplex TaxID=6269 RepID=A0A0M3JMJ2_ANISI|nr:unnamed protein product [Anisakis simplex]